jgi:O-antigen/teichoic acid export membrane protein
MSLRHAIARNMAWNMAGMAVVTAIGFVIAPVLVHRLGETTYGLWILILSVTGYFGMLDLGVRSSVARHIAYLRASNDHQEAGAVLSTALVILLVVAALTLVGTLAACLLFFQLFEVPPEQTDSVRTALLLTGANLALVFVLNAFDAALWAIQRMDVVNAIDIPISLGRAALTLVLVRDSGDLVALAVLTLLTSVAAGIIKAIAAWRLDPSFRVSLSLVRLSAARSIFSYGIWRLMLEAALLMSSQTSVLIVGACVSIQLVTSYSIAGRLVGYASAILAAATGILMPVAATFDAAQDHDRQRRLFVQGGAVCAAFALYCMGGFLFLGRPLIEIWMGPELADAAYWLAILAIGHVPRMSQWVTHTIIMALGRHRFIACVCLAESLAATLLALLLAPHYGLLGICLAFSVCNALSCGLVQMVYGCRLLGIPLRVYLAQALSRPLAAAILPMLLLFLIDQWQAPSGWLQFLLAASAYTACYLALAIPILGAWDGLRSGRLSPFHAAPRVPCLLEKDAL